MQRGEREREIREPAKSEKLRESRGKREELHWTNHHWRLMPVAPWSPLTVTRSLS
jgi:hypothetical protein